MLKNFFKIAWRKIKREKIFSFINITGLALSLSAFWFILLYISNELSFDKYHKNADRIFRLVTHGKEGNNKFDLAVSSKLAAEAFKSEFPEVENSVRIDPEGGGIIDYENKKIKDDAIFFTDSTYFSIFTHQFLVGDAHALDGANTIVLTKTLAAKYFSTPEDAINKIIYIEQIPAQIKGVIEDVPANSHFTFNALRSMPSGNKGDWNNLNIYTYLLLKKNADVKELQRKMPEFIERNLKSNATNTNYSFQLQPLGSIHLHSHLSYELGKNSQIKNIYIFSAIGFLILLIAFINYINIATASASVRLREVALRKIIGSSKRNLIGLFLTESVLTVIFSAIISIFLLKLMMPLLYNITGKQLSLWQFGTFKTILFIIGFSFITGIIGGLYPAFFLSKFKAIPALKNQLGNVKGQTFFRNALVTFQFTVTVIMLTVSLIIYLQIKFILNTDLGFNKKELISFHLDSRTVRQNIPSLQNALLQNPIVKAVASSGNPIGNNDIGMTSFSVEKNGVFEQKGNLANGLIIDADFIPTMQIKLLEGRNFSTDFSSDSNNIIVNKSFIKSQGWTSGMGKRIAIGNGSEGKSRFANIIGVVKDYNIYSLQYKIEPMIMQLPQKPEDRDNLYVRIDENHSTKALAYIEKTFRNFDPSSPFDYHFVDNNFSTQYNSEEKQGQILLAFTLLTICISCLGLFGLITFTVNRRIKEIGIRKVIGASAASVVTLLTESLLKLVILAMFLAIPISWVIMHKWLEGFAYRIKIEWWMFLLSGIISLFIAIGTLSFKAVKAAIANPVKSLRSE